MKKNILYIILILFLLPTITFAKLAEDKALQKLTQTKSIDELSARNTDYNKSLAFPPNVNIAAWAEAHYGMGVSVGDLLIDIREDETSYRIEAHLLTSGLAKKITNFNT